MLGFARASVSRFARVQPARQLASAASATTTNAETTSIEISHKKKKSKTKELGTVANRMAVSPPVKEVELLEKYREDIDKKELTSLNEVVEAVEWREHISVKTLEKITELCSKDKEMLSSLNDRQLSILLSAYGTACNSMAAHKRSNLLNIVLSVLEDKKIILGTKARGSLLACRIDNGEAVNVVEELLAWDAAGVALDSFAYSKLAKIYANQGNLQGVVDIVNHMKLESLPVDTSLFETMVYAIAKSGQYAQAEIAIKKFSSQPDQSELRLRVSAARAAAARSDLNVAIQQLSMIPSSFDIHRYDNNILILPILYQFLENGQYDAIDQLRPFLTMTDDGATLTAKHRNSTVISNAARMQFEGKLVAALRTFSLVHPSARKNRYLEEDFCSSISNRIHSENITIDEIVSLTNLAKSVGVVSDTAVFLLSQCAKTCPVQRAREIYNLVKERGELEGALESNSSLKISLCEKLTEDLQKLTPETQISTIVEAAHILFKSLKGHPFNDIYKMYSVIFNIVGKDVSLPISVIPLIDDSNVQRRFTTAIIHQLLCNKKKSEEEKLEKFLDSGVAKAVNLHYMTNKVIQLLIENNCAEKNGIHLKLAAKIIALSFPEKGYAKYACKNLVDVLNNELVTEKDTNRIVALLKKELRVYFSNEDLMAAKKVLVEDKYAQIEKLKKKRNDIVRFNSLSIEELEKELDNVSKKTRTYFVLREVILTKIIKNRPIDITLAERHIRETLDSNPTERLIRLTSFVQNVAFKQVLEARQLDQAKSFWALRGETPNLEFAVAFAALLHLNGQKEQAEVVFNDIRKITTTIKRQVLDAVGTYLVDFSESELESVAAILREKFNLNEKQTRTVVNAKKLKEIINLIEQGKLIAAFELAAYESNASGRAFGQYEVARAAIRNGDSALLKNVFNLIVNHHSRTVAYLDIAYVMLEEGQEEHAQKMLNANGLFVTSAQLAYFVQQAVSNQRPDILRGLFTGLNTDGRSNTVDLNNLLMNLVRLYYKFNDWASLSSLEDECKKISFPLEARIRSIFDNINEKKSLETAV